MGFIENKFEYSIAGMAIVLMAGLLHLFSGMSGSRAQVESDIVYEMPRPKNFQGSDFDLSGREIDRNYINPFSKKEVPAQVALAKGNDKDKAAKAKPVVAAAKKSAGAKVKKGLQVTTRIIAAGPNATLDKDGIFADNSKFKRNRESGVAAVTPNTNSGEGTEKDDANQMSPDQWRALILAQPTKANMDKLIQARNKNEVDSGTFNMIVEDVLKNTNPAVQEVGLYGAKTFPTAESFMVVAQAQESLVAEQKTSAEAFLRSYGQGARLAALMSVLQVSDQVVVAKATQVFVTGYQGAKNGTNISAPRSGRGDILSSGLSAYIKFTPLFQQLAQSSDSALAALANSALAQIQTA